MTTSSPAQRTLTNYFAATRSMDRAAWIACFAADGVSHDPVGTPPHVGHTALARFFDSIVDLAKSIAFHEEEIYFSGNEAAVKWIARGVGKKSEKSFMFEGIDVFEFDEQGKIKTLSAYWDPADLMSQLE